jgi:hypothetical protein
MACPIKTPDGEIDPQALNDLTEVGGFLHEGGNKKFGPWSEAMKAYTGDIFNDADLYTIYQNVRAAAKERTGTEQTPPTPLEQFIAKSTAKLGGIKPAANFAN